MSEGNRNPEGQELGSTVRQSAGLNPDAVPMRRKKRNGSNRRTQLTEVNSEKKMGKRTRLLDCNSWHSRPENNKQLGKRPRRGVLDMRAMRRISDCYI
jgi:hypothetical protein